MNPNREMLDLVNVHVVVIVQIVRDMEMGKGKQVDTKRLESMIYMLCLFGGIKGAAFGYPYATDENM